MVNAKPAGRSTRSTRLLFVCHGEGLHHRFTELSTKLAVDDSGLTAAGWEQANTLAVWLRAHEEVEILISGTQLRSRLTGQRIAQVLGQPLVVDQNLPGTPNPRAWPSPHLGTHQLPVPTAATRSEVHETTSSAPQEAANVNGRSQFVQRLLTGFAQIVDQYWGKTIVVVTHADAIATIVSCFFGAPHLDVQVENTSVTEIAWQEDHWQLRYLNRREHLPQPALPPSAVQPQPQVASDEDEHLATVREVFNRVAPIYAKQKRQADAERIQHLIRFAGLPASLEILDVGTGPGTLPLALAEAGAALVLGVDISEGMLEQAEFLRLSSARTEDARRTGYRLAPAHNLPFADNRFDVVICRLVLQHLVKPARSIQEMCRVLKPGGYFVLAELLSTDDPVKRATQNAIEERRDRSHVAARSADQYRKLLQDAGLSIEKSEVTSFDRELDEWLSTLDTSQANRAAVREMLEAGLETDAAGINVRRRGETLHFDQRMIYLKALKPLG